MKPLPKKYERYRSMSGRWSKFTKTLLFGGEKAGKSRLAAGAPGPRIAIDSGEFGIQPYLSPDDVCLTVLDAAEQADVFCWACEQAEKGEAATIILDSGTVFWNAVKDKGYEEAGTNEVRFQDWAKIKKPVKKLVAAAMRVPANVIVTCWLKDLIVERDDSAPVPGIKRKTKLQPKAVELPDIEKRFGYFFDFIYGLERGLDHLNRPNGEFKVTFWGGRIPPSVPPGLLYTGRVWVYDTKQEVKPPEQVYNDVIGWLQPYKEKGGVPRLLGYDPQQAKAAWLEIEKSVQDETVGNIVKILMEIETPEQWRAEAEQKILPIATTLNEESKTMVQRLINQRKAEIGVD